MFALIIHVVDNLSNLYPATKSHVSYFKVQQKDKRSCLVLTDSRPQERPIEKYAWLLVIEKILKGPETRSNLRSNAANSVPLALFV